MKSIKKTLLLWLIVAVILVSIFNIFAPTEIQNKITYSDFVKAVDAGNVKSISVFGLTVKGQLTDEKRFSTQLLQPLTDDSPLTKELLKKNVAITSTELQPSFLIHLINLLPWIIVIIIFLYFMRKKQR